MDEVVAARQAHRWPYATDKAGHRRDGEGERKDAPIHGQADCMRSDPGEIGRIQCEERSNTCLSQGQPETSANEGQQQTLGDQLTNKLPSASANRGANRDLPLPDRPADQRHVRNVGARNQEHKRHCAYQHQKGRSYILNQRVLERRNREGVVRPARLRKPLMKCLARKTCLCLGERDRYARPEPGRGNQ